VPDTATKSAPPAPSALPEAVVRVWCAFGLVCSVLLAGVATLTPEGTGWRWGNPLTDVWWYATGFGSAATMVQLFGNLALLAPPAAFVVRIWPRLARPAVLAAVAVAAGVSIETLQWLLAIGRVVSPVDALLNAAGAVLAAAAVVRLRRRSAPLVLPAQ
jgi:VanZ like family